jgi:hypothetical protein
MNFPDFLVAAILAGTNFSELTNLNNHLFLNKFC